MQQFLDASEVIDWHHSEVSGLARRLSGQTPEKTARRCFEWVRDEIKHSGDYRLNLVTCSASEVLHVGSGFCYAKSHLLAALLRANAIPAGLCYQRLSLDDSGTSFCLHGLSAVYLPEFGWYRIDARGNKANVNAQFTPPAERLAFRPQVAGEFDLPGIYGDPLGEVVAALRRYKTFDELACHLPDLGLAAMEAIAEQ